MHYQYWPLSITAPAGTLITAPVTAAWTVPQGRLRRIEVDIPSGAGGTVGIRVVYQGQVIWPWATGGWLTPFRAGYSVEWDDEIMARGLQVQMYNPGVYPHTTYWRAEVWPAVGSGPGGGPGQLAGHPAGAPQFAQIAALSGGAP